MQSNKERPRIFTKSVPAHLFEFDARTREAFFEESYFNTYRMHNVVRRCIKAGHRYPGYVHEPKVKKQPDPPKKWILIT